MAWLTGWNYRKPVTISNSGSTLADYQILITIDTSTLVTAGKLLSSCNDIRFSSSDGSTLLNYWIESGCNTTSTKIWIKVPSIATGSNTIYLYYNNLSATSSSSGTSTFDFFDDFSGDLSKWTVSQSSAGNVQIISGEVSITGNNNWNVNGITSINNISRPSVIEWKSRTSTTTLNTFEGYSTQPLSYTSGLQFHRHTDGNIYRSLDGSYAAWYGWSSSQTTQKIILKPTQGYTIFWDGIQKEDNSSWATNNDKIAFQIFHTGAYLYVDDVIVRKYVSPEPTTCIGEEVSTISWLTGWSKRKLLTITGSTSGAQTDYQMKLTVHKSAGTDTSTDIYLGTNVKDDFSDIRFTSSNGSTTINYWIESYTSGSVATVWIKIPSIPINLCTTTIYLYYNNAGASSISSGTGTFDFFDDFNRSDGALGNGWTIGGGNASISGNKALVGDSGSSDGWVYNATSGAVNGIVITSDFQLITASQPYGGILARRASGGNWISSGYGWMILNNSTLSIYDNGTSKTSVSKTLTLDTWYNTEMIIAPDNAMEVRIWLKTDSRPSTATISYAAFSPASSGTNVQITGAGEYNANHTYFDNFYVRKYISPVPTFSAIGTEETETCNAPSANLIVLEIISNQLLRPYPSYIDLDAISKLLDNIIQNRR